MAVPFPDTDRTWIVERLEEGATETIRTHLMTVYAEPLQQAARERFRLTAEAALDLVHGFFAARLAQADYLRQWDQRQLPLRQWLWKGLWFHAHERWRAERRMPTLPEVPDVHDQRLADPGETIDRAFVTAIVRAAMQKAREACARDGFAEHWRVFERRHLHGERLAELARQLDLTPDRVLVMQRAPRRRFHQALVELLIADGTPAAEVPRVLRQLQDLLP